MSDARCASLAPLARALGGDTYAGGRCALIPAPGHSAADRSVSLRLVEGRVLAHSFGAADWRDVLEALRAGGWIDADNRLCAGGAVVGRPRGDVERSRVERVHAAQALWAQAGVIDPGSPAWAHGMARGVALRSEALRFHRATPLSVYRDRGPRLPALLAAVTDRADALSALEVTYLDGRGARSRLARPARKLVGAVPPGSAVRLAEPAAAMLVAEGVFTALSAMVLFGLPGWALLSTGNLRGWCAPPGVRQVLIAGDRGPDGERSAARLRRALVRSGLAAEVVLPAPGVGDWNDVLRARSGEEGRIGAPGPEGWSLPAGWERSHAHHPTHS